jgi:hypothetical protein
LFLDVGTYLDRCLFGFISSAEFFSKPRAILLNITQITLSGLSNRQAVTMTVIATTNSDGRNSTSKDGPKQDSIHPFSPRPQLWPAGARQGINTPDTRLSHRGLPLLSEYEASQVTRNTTPPSLVLAPKLTRSLLPNLPATTPSNFFPPQGSSPIHLMTTPPNSTPVISNKHKPPPRIHKRPHHCHRPFTDISTLRKMRSFSSKRVLAGP